MYAIREPSGDQSGSNSRNAVRVSRRSAVPSVRMVESSGPVRRLYLKKAIRSPRGDQAGSSADQRRLTRTAFSEFDPDWSPDGARIAYTRSWHEQPCRSDVYVVAADGGRSRKVLDRGCDDSDPSWAPNGARIVLYSNRPQGTPGWRRKSGLWTVRPDGSGARLLVQGLFAGAPDWQSR